MRKDRILTAEVVEAIVERENFERTRSQVVVTYETIGNDHGELLSEVMNRVLPPTKIVIRSTTVKQTVTRF